MSRLRSVAGLAALGGMLAALVTVAWGQAKPAAPAAKWELTKEQKARVAKLKNPVPPDQKAASVERGKQLAMTNCVPCHGQSGKGDGPGAAALPKKPADWTSKVVQSESDAALFVRITDGNAPMPPWGSLPEKDRWDLVNYVKSLGKKA